MPVIKVEADDLRAVLQYCWGMCMRLLHSATQKSSRRNTKAEPCKMLGALPAFARVQVRAHC